jgi:uncharacterized protein
MPAARLWRHSVTELLRYHGTRREVHVAAPMDDLVLSNAVVPHDQDVVADVVLESIADGSVTATGSITVPWVGECRRCLQPVSGVAVIDVQEVFVRGSALDDTYPLDGDLIDLQPMVRDAALLALPLAPLCRDDCPGPDPDAHPVSLEPEEAPEVISRTDPRWAGLGELRLGD